MCEETLFGIINSLYHFAGFNPDRNMYLTIAKKLFDFLEIDALPTPLKRRTTACSSAAKLSRFLVEENDGSHKTCISMYNKQKFERKRKCYEHAKSIGSDHSDCAEGPSMKLKRLKMKVRNNSESCFNIYI